MSLGYIPFELIRKSKLSFVKLDSIDVVSIEFENSSSSLAELSILLELEPASTILVSSIKVLFVELSS